MAISGESNYYSEGMPRLWLAEMEPGEYKYEPLAKLESILLKARGVIQSDGMMHASLGPPFARPFARDTYISGEGGLRTREDFGVEDDPIIDVRTLTTTQLAYLQYMNSAGELPHEVGTRAQGFPAELPVDEQTGIGMLFNSIDANGYAMRNLDQLLDFNPELYTTIMPCMRRLAIWAINNIAAHDGLIAGGNTWQDGENATLDSSGNWIRDGIAYSLEQALYWEALQKVAQRFSNYDVSFSRQSLEAARLIEKTFNRTFIYDGDRGPAIARAVYGENYTEQIRSSNIDNLIALGYTYHGRTILDDGNTPSIPHIVRLHLEQLFTPYIGLRNQGLDSPELPDYTYHTKSSFWLMPNARVVRTLAYPLKKLFPSEASELSGYATAIAQASVGSLLAVGLPFETGQLAPDNTITPYRVMRDGKQIFRGADGQAWTMLWGRYLGYFLNAQGIRDIAVPTKVEWS